MSNSAWYRDPYFWVGFAVAFIGALLLCKTL